MAKKNKNETNNVSKTEKEESILNIIEIVKESKEENAIEEEVIVGNEEEVILEKEEKQNTTKSKKEKVEKEVKIEKEVIKSKTPQDHLIEKLNTSRYYEIYFRGMKIYTKNEKTSPIAKDNALYINAIPYPYNAIEIKY